MPPRRKGKAARGDGASTYFTADEIAQGLGGKRRGGGWNAPCPAHDDRRPSLSITQGDAGLPLIYCHAGCTQEAVIEQLKTRGLWHRDSNPKKARGQSDGKFAGIYTYPLEDGMVLEKGRFDKPDGSKYFRWRKQGDGGPAGLAWPGLNQHGIKLQNIPLYNIDYVLD